MENRTTIGIISADTENIEGFVYFDNFELRQLSYIERVDILKDILGVVGREYHHALLEEKAS